MSAEIIPFPTLNKIQNEIDSKTVDIANNWPYTVAGVPVIPPTTGQDYLELCKRFLEPEDYTDMLVGIMDKDAYDGLEPQMQKLIDNYFDFGKL